MIHTTQNTMVLLKKVVFMLLLILCSNSFAEGYKGFYKEKPGRGFYWYEDPVVKKKEKETEKINEKKKNSRIPKERSVEEMWNMHPDDFQVYMNKVTKYAVQKPSEKNMLMFIKANYVSSQKSTAFASVYALMTQKHPELTNSENNSVTNPGKKSQDEIKYREIDDLINESKNNFTIILFKKDGDKRCEAQKKILYYFERKYKWQIKDIDLDLNPHIAKKYKIKRVPYLLLLNDDLKEMPLSLGVIAMNTLTERLYRSIRYMNGDISPEQYVIHEFKMGSGSDPLSFLNNSKKKKD
ncbi:MAG: conjugal transfer protein TraF [Desulfobacterales bacterium]|nr:conjugal transfer protein TraF [Desulfobacterales bacterium]